ncbi:MAG: hypothetical protein HY075_04215 [Deltaproteobacteria bacterium]|nr:hypothetical protein [Deltaproteobacteria bacterium]
MTDLDRRKFLQRSGATVGGALVNPKLGVFAAAAAAAGAIAGRGATAAETGAVHEVRRLLRSGEPINSRGQPFGHDVTALALVSAPAADPTSRVLVVAGHGSPRPGCEERIARKTVGISVVELEYEKTAKSARWRHEVASEHNRRWDLDTPIPMDGARMAPDEPAFRVQRVDAPVGAIACVAATPWQSVLCAERGGWIVEVHAVSGTAIRRLSLGRVDAVSIAVRAEAGKAIVVELESARGGTFKFVSHQRFDPRLPQGNVQSLLIGELFFRQGGEPHVWAPVTEGLVGEEWAGRLADPFPAATAATAAPLATVAAGAQSPRAGAFFVERETDGASVLSG